MEIILNLRKMRDTLEHLKNPEKVINFTGMHKHGIII